MKKKWEKPKHIDTVVNSIQTSSFPITNTLSNTKQNLRPQVHYFEINLATYSCADQDVVSDKIT